MKIINKQLNIEPNPAVEWDYLCSKIEIFSIYDLNEKNPHLSDNEEVQKEEIDLEEVIPSPETLLRNRKLGQRLSWYEKELICKLHENDKVPMATLQHRFEVSLSTLKRIIAQ